MEMEISALFYLEKVLLWNNLPVNLTPYSSSSNYPSSPALGSGKVVYRGTASSVNIINIPPGEYHVTIIEYNGSSAPVYRNVDPLTGIVNVGSKPLVPATNISFSAVEGNRMSMSFTRGDGISRILIAKEGSPVDAFPADFTDYTPNQAFGSGSELGSGNFVIASTTGFNFTITNLEPSTTYHFAIVEVNGSGINAFYQESSVVATTSNATLSAPTVVTSEFFANNITGNSAQITWTRGDGDGRLIIAREGTPIDVLPIDLANYFPSTNFGSGTQISPGIYTVYSSSGDNVTIRNLQPGTTYHTASFEYNGNSGKVYLTDNPTRTSFTTAPRPSVPSSNLTISSVEGDRFTLFLNERQRNQKVGGSEKGRFSYCFAGRPKHLYYRYFW